MKVNIKRCAAIYIQPHLDDDLIIEKPDYFAKALEYYLIDNGYVNEVVPYNLTGEAYRMSIHNPVYRKNLIRYKNKYDAIFYRIATKNLKIKQCVNRLFLHMFMMESGVYVFLMEK